MTYSKHQKSGHDGSEILAKSPKPVREYFESAVPNLIHCIDSLEGIELRQQKQAIDYKEVMKESLILMSKLFKIETR